MILVPINYWAVLVCTIISMVLGSLWYGPFFGKQWSKLMGFTAEKMAAAKKKGIGSSYVTMTIGSLIMSYTMAFFVTFVGFYYMGYGAGVGFLAGFMAWIGFVAPVTMGSVLWEGKPWKLWFINNAYYLVLLLIIGKILAVWR